MLVNAIKIFQKMKTKGQLSIEKNFMKYKKLKNGIQVTNFFKKYKKFGEFNYWFFQTDSGGWFLLESIRNLCWSGWCFFPRKYKKF